MRTQRSSVGLVRMLMVLGLLTMSAVTALAAPPAPQLGVTYVKVLVGEDEFGPVYDEAELVWQDPGQTSYYWRLPTSCKGKEITFGGQFATKVADGWNYAGHVNWHPTGVVGWAPVTSIEQEEDVHSGVFSCRVPNGFTANNLWIHTELKQSHGATLPEQIKTTLCQLVFED